MTESRDMPALSRPVDAGDTKVAVQLSPARRRIEFVLSIVAFLFALVYPFAIYFGMLNFGARGVGLVMLVLIIPFVIRRARRLDGRAIGTVLEAPVIIVALALVTVAVDDIAAVLVLPVLINGALCVTFARSLRKEHSMVENFARLLVSDLSAEEITYCRSVTRAWCVFFIVNGVTAAIFAIAAPLSWWVVYTGLLSYALIGIFFSVEVLIRFHRFRRTGMPWLDRALGRLWRGRVS